MKICPRCGNQNPDLNNFCNFCGQPLPAVQQPQPQQPWEPQQPPKKGIRKGVLILLLVIGFIVVALITTIIVILIRTGGSPKPSESYRPSHASRDRDEDEDEDEDEEDEEEEEEKDDKKTSSSAETKEEEKKAKKTYVIEVDSLGVETTRYTYDVLGRTTRVEYADMPDGYANSWTTYQYGALGKRSRRDNSDGSYVEYDLEGREILSADAYGNVAETTYDENGNMIESIGPSSHHYMEYDAQGRPTKETVNTRLADGTETLQIEATYEYSEDGLYKAMTTYNVETGVTRLTTEWRYDEAGNEIYCHIYSRSGENDMITETEYDEDGKILWTQNLTVDGTVTNRVDYIYDEYGNLIQTVNGGTGVLDGTVTYTNELDENGRILLVTRHEVNPGTNPPIDATWVTDVYEYTDRGDVRYHYEYTVGVDLSTDPYSFIDEYTEKGKEYFTRVTIYVYDYDNLDPASLIPEQKY